MSRSHCSTRASTVRTRSCAAASQRGIDIVGGDADALAAPRPDEPADLERHGTEMAGLLVGSGGPGGTRRRRAGRDAAADPRRGLAARRDRELGRCTGAPTRSSQGSSAPSTRTPTVTRTTPRALRSSASRSRSPAFCRRPARPCCRGRDAARHARRHSRRKRWPCRSRATAASAGPGGAPAALTVGAVDLRPRIRRGARRAAHRLAGRARRHAPARREQSRPSRPDRCRHRRTACADDGADAAIAARFRCSTSSTGAALSLVAGRAALVRAGVGSRLDGCERRARGSRRGAVLRRGSSRRRDRPRRERADPGRLRSRRRRRTTSLTQIARGTPATVSLGAVRTETNSERGTSRALLVDGPRLRRPREARGRRTRGRARDAGARERTPTVLRVTEPSTGRASPRRSSPAPPRCLRRRGPISTREALKSLIVGSARPLPDDPSTAQGVGADRHRRRSGDGGRARCPSVARIRPRADSERWRGGGGDRPAQRFYPAVLNLSLDMRVAREGAAALEFELRPQRVVARRRTDRPRPRARTRCRCKLEGRRPPRARSS